MEKMKDREIGEVFCYHLSDRGVYLRVDESKSSYPCKCCYFDKLAPYTACLKDYGQTGSCNACLREDNNNVIFRLVYRPKKKLTNKIKNNMEK